MLIGYMRVSKADGSQVLDLQRDALIGGGVSSDHLYEGHASSGKRGDRSGLDACLKSLRKGDTLVAWKLDRIGRDLRHLVNLVHDLTKRGVGLRVLAGEGAAIDTATPNGRLMFGFFAALAEFEHELIVERTKAGLASARARGRNVAILNGRPPAANCQSGLQWAACGLVSAVGADFLRPSCNALRSTLANCRFLRPTLARIAEDCGRANHYLSRATAAVDFGN